MATIAWWTIPIVTGLFMVVWAARATRSRPAIDMFDTLRRYQRFREVMERDVDRRG